MKSLHEVMSDIRGGFARLSTAEQAGVAASLAGQEAMSGLLAIANAAPDDFDKLTDAIDHSTGAAKRMADIRLDNLAGDVIAAREDMAERRGHRRAVDRRQYLRRSHRRPLESHHIALAKSRTPDIESELSFHVDFAGYPPSESVCNSPA